MKIEEIQELIKLVETSQIEELEVRRWGKKVIIRKHAGRVQVVSDAPPASDVAHTPTPSPAQAEAPKEPETPAGKPFDFEIKSPMVGSFYRASAPDAEPFVKEGDAVSAGQVLCIIEAMKVMNEIVAEQAGTVSEILVETGGPVEFDQTLMRFVK